MNDEESERPANMPIADIRLESGSEDLLSSPTMQPYMRMAIALMQGEDSASAMGEIEALPLEQRYVWRVGSALKWAFADFDTICVEADRQTLSQEDQHRLLELLRNRPMQFCMFLSTLIGQKPMEQLMIAAIRNSRLAGGT